MTMLSDQWLLTIALVVLAVMLLPSMIVITSQQNVKLIETFGRFTSVRQAGLSIKLPWPIQTAKFRLIHDPAGTQPIRPVGSSSFIVTVRIRGWRESSR